MIVQEAVCVKKKLDCGTETCDVHSVHSQHVTATAFL